MRVLHVITSLEMGGATTVVVDLLKGLQRYQSITLQLCSLGSRISSFKGLALPLEVEFLDSALRFGDLRDSYHCIRKLRATVGKFKPDIVHTHLWLADVIGGVSISGLGAKHLSHQHNVGLGLAGKGPRALAKRLLTRGILRHTDANVVAVAHATRNYASTVLGIADAKCRVIRNGVDVETFRPVSLGETSRRSDRLIIGVAGRLTHEKGFQQTIRAVAKLREEGVDAQLLIAGTGPLEGSLIGLARALHISDHVMFLGALQDMREFYRRLDVFVLSSLYTEGLSICILEAMAMGKAIVATRVGGNTEAIREGEEGFLVPAGEVQQLALTLQRFASNSGLATQMGGKARKRACAMFALQRMTEEIADYYARLLHQDPPSIATLLP